MAVDNTYTAIATQTLGSAAASVTFSSIPSTYTDLVLVCNIKGTASAYLMMQFNGDTATNYSETAISGYGGSPYSWRESSVAQMTFSFSGGSMDALWTNSIFSVQNYANTTTYKTTLTRYNSPSNEVTAAVGLWRSTSAINSIKVLTSVSTYASGSTFSLYGIKAA